MFAQTVFGIYVSSCCNSNLSDNYNNYFIDIEKNDQSFVKLRFIFKIIRNKFFQHFVDLNESILNIQVLG